MSVAELIEGVKIVGDLQRLATVLAETGPVVHRGIRFSGGIESGRWWVRKEFPCNIRHE